MKEIWKNIKEFENYQVSNLGNLKNKKTNKILKLRPSHRGYLKTNVSSNGKIKTVFLHRLVAEAFISNPNNFPQVNHKDENKLNNKADNLEWCTAKYNCNYGSAIEKRATKTRKKINQYDLNDNYLATFNSLTIASKFVNGNTSHISNCCKGKRQTAYGYKWKYYN